MHETDGGGKEVDDLQSAAFEASGTDCDIRKSQIANRKSEPPLSAWVSLALVIPPTIVTQLAGVLVGFAAMGVIRRRASRGMAIVSFSITFGIAWGIALSGLVAFHLYGSEDLTLPGGRAHRPDALCRRNLEEIGRACLSYVDTHGAGRFFPPGLEELLRLGLLDRRALVCPLEADRQQDSDFVSSYRYVNPEEHPGGGDPDRTIVAYERRPNHTIGHYTRSHAVLYADGRAGVLSRSDLEKRLRRGALKR